MNARRFAVIILSILTTIFVLTALGLAGGSPVLAQSPTPTLIPTLTTGGDLGNISSQVAQAAEFSRDNYYLSLEILSEVQASNVDTRTTYYKELSDGHEFRVDRTYSYGDLVIIIALIALLLLTVIKFIWDVVRAR